MSSLLRLVGISQGITVKDLPRDMSWERQFQLAIDAEAARKVREERTPADSKVCTMCGDHCALKIIKENLNLER